MEKYLLSCDWGSTSFRLRLIAMPGQSIVGGIASDDGIIRTYNSWKENAEQKGISRKQFFLDQLKRQITVLANKLQLNLDGVTVIISGMASSSIGMVEMPYALLPFAIDGSNAAIQKIEGDFPNPVLLISGISSGEDVVRGEETQLIGIASLLKLQKKEAILILPGTHSKHLHIKNGGLVNIQTYMTGEVFSLLINHSILKDSVAPGDINELSEGDIDAFKSGVERSSSFNILSNLFTVRTNQLFDKLNKQHNFFYLSGLLIGTEISRLRDNGGIPLILCGGSNLYRLYELALQELRLFEQTSVISADSVDEATIAGQIIIAEKNDILITI
jgi:2-dehydro-3-deoxygalactonokinase